MITLDASKKENANRLNLRPDATFKPTPQPSLNQDNWATNLLGMVLGNYEVGDLTHFGMVQFSNEIASEIDQIK